MPVEDDAEGRAAATPAVLRALVLGPLAWPTWRGALAGLLAMPLLLVLTQVGPVVVWLAVGFSASRRRPLRALAISLPTAWLLGLVVVPLLAPLAGRQALPCAPWGPLRARSVLFCVAHRHYVVPGLAADAQAIAKATAAAHPGTVVRYLDAGFPFADGFPLLPHLSHDDGEKLDLALLYTDAEGASIDGGGSPIGYFGYVAPLGSPACPAKTWDLRWDLELLQPLLAPRLDAKRSATLVREATKRAGIRKLLLEPHLQRRLGVSSAKVRFQGCRAARHDDHVHIQR